VKTLVSGLHPAGTHTIPFAADKLPSGIYFYWFEAGGYTDLRKMILLK